VNLDRTLQEKIITFPTDAKKCSRITDREGIVVRQSCTPTLKKLGVDQRFRNHPRNKKKAIKADKR